jgi:5-methylcytosine-specific restriction endonuclease McrA
MAKLPAFQFYPGDWMKDPQVSMLSPATRGIWIDLICLMHENGRTGLITGLSDQLCRACRCSAAEFVQAVKEIKDAKTADVTEREGVISIINRRMRREWKERTDTAQRQQKFREKGGGDPDKWTAIRANIMLRDNKVCAYCGRKATAVDHVHPRTKGGGEEDWNLVAACKTCNSKKCDRTLLEAGMNFWKGFDLEKVALNPFLKNDESNMEITPYTSSSSSISNTNTQVIEWIWDDEKQKFLQDGNWIYKFCMEKKLQPEQFNKIANGFLTDLELKEDYKPIKEIRSHFTNWFNKGNAKPGAKIEQPSGPTVREIQEAENRKKLGI